MATKQIFDIAVIGAGPAGLIAAAACAQSGLRTAIVGAAPARIDRRTSALFGGSIELLKKLRLWNALEPASEPISGIRIVDASDHLIRAPEVLFRAEEAGLPAFGYNIPNAALTAALEAPGDIAPERFPTDIVRVDIGAAEVTLTCKDGETLQASLVVAADGRTSSTRTAAGIEVSSWSYPQSAVVTTFHHERPHGGISTELHRTAGPVTVVPGPGKTSNLVWIDTPDESARLIQIDTEAFARELSRKFKDLLGTLSDFSPRQSFSLIGQTARPLAKNRVIVVGEAAHVIPPIGAQGLNLSCRDAAALAEIVEDAKRAGNDFGSAETLARYDDSRRADVGTRVFAVDLLNRSLLSSHIPGVSLARGLGMFALASSSSLRTRMMQEGIRPAASNPALMGGRDM